MMTKTRQTYLIIVFMIMFCYRIFVNVNDFDIFMSEGILYISQK